MRKIKTAALILLLIAATVCVIFLPQFISNKKEEALINKTEYGNYSTENRAKITSRQVALLLYNREIEIGRYNPIFSDSIVDNTALKADSEKLFEAVFKDDKTLQAKIKTLLHNGSVSYGRSSILTMADNQPVALSFVEVGIKGENGVVSYVYEEKTKALIYFSYSSEKDPVKSVTDGEMFWGRLLLAMNEYYKEQLGLDSSQFFYTGEIMEITENIVPESEGEMFLMSCFAVFGVATDESNDPKEEILYNFDTE